jgi:hypothetical protein
MMSLGWAFGRLGADWTLTGPTSGTFPPTKQRSKQIFTTVLFVVAVVSMAPAGFSLAHVIIHAMSSAVAALKIGVIYENFTLLIISPIPVTNQDRNLLLAGFALQFIVSTISALSTALFNTEFSEINPQ